jgi:hypothetical protein
MANEIKGLVNITTGQEIFDADARYSSINLTEGMRVRLDGQGFAIVAGFYEDIPVYFAGTITGWKIFNSNRIGGSDAISIDVRKCTYAQYASNPYPITSIVASEPLALSGGAYSAAGSCVGWTTVLAAGDMLRFYVSSCADLTNLSIILNITRT